MLKTLKTTIVSRNDELSNWTSLNPFLKAGEQALVKDGSSYKMKVGDGASHFNDLPYLQIEYSQLSGDTGWQSFKTEDDTTKIFSVSALPEVTTEDIGKTFFLKEKQGSLERGIYQVSSDGADGVEFKPTTDFCLYSNVSNDISVIGRDYAEQYMNGIERSFLKTVSALPDIATMTDEDMNRAYFLMNSDGGFTKGQVVRVVKDNGVAVFQDVNWTTPVSSVTKVRYSFKQIDGVDTLYVWWTDPYDMGDAAWKKTELVYKCYEEGTPDGQLVFPMNESDGTLAYSTTVKNEHQSVALKLALQNTTTSENPIYCFRFFTSSVDGAYDYSETKNSTFTSEQFSYTGLCEALERYNDLAYTKMLPDPGDILLVDWIFNDYYKDGNTTITCNTVDDVLGHADQMSASMTEWFCLGYNAYVPQYIKYFKEDGEGNRNYVYVCSVHDEETISSVVDLNGDTSSKTFVQDRTCTFRPITSGARVYVGVGQNGSTFNTTTGLNEWQDSGLRVQSVSEDVFTYRETRTGYTVRMTYDCPNSIVVNGDEYRFCGYTMTIQPVGCLGNMVFDPAELALGTPTKTYDTHWSTPQSDYGFYYLDKTDGVLKSVDLSVGTSESLQGTICKGVVNAQGLTCDVYKEIDCFDKTSGDRMLELYSPHFEANWRYILADPNQTTNNTPATSAYINLLVTDEFDGKMRYANYSTMVRYNGNTYMSLNNLSTTTLANTKPTLSSAGTNGYWQLYDYTPGVAYANNAFVKAPDGRVYRMTSALAAGANTSIDDVKSKSNLYGIDLGFTTDDIVPSTVEVDGVTYKIWLFNSDTNRGSGCNIWSQSSYRKNANSKFGSGEFSRNYLEESNPYDTITQATYNPPHLKMVKEPGLSRHIIPCVVNTRMSNMTWWKSKKYWFASASSDVKHECTIDRFYPATGYEVCGNTDSALNSVQRFVETYPNDNSRKKGQASASGTYGTPVLYWLRTPTTGPTYSVASVYTSGQYYNYSNLNSANSSYGFSPACTLG